MTYCRDVWNWRYNFWFVVARFVSTRVISSMIPSNVASNGASFLDRAIIIFKNSRRKRPWTWAYFASYDALETLLAT